MKSSKPDTPAGPSKKPDLRAWAVMAMLLVFMLINYADKAVLGLAANPIMRELGLSHSEYGLLASSFFFLFNISAVAFGFLANRFPAKWLLFGMALVWALTQLPVVAGAGFAALLVSRIVLGAAEGPAQPVAMHAAFKWFPNEKRSIPSSLISGGGGLGGVLAAPLLTLVIINFGWRWAFLSLFVVGVLWCAVWAVVGREGTADRATAATGAEPERAEDFRVPYHRILLSGTWLAGFVGAFGAYWTSALLLAWVPSYLETSLGYSAVAAGAIVTAPWVLKTVATFGQGALTQWLMHRGVSSRVSRGVLGGCAVFLAGAAMLLAPFVTHHGLKIALITVAFSIGAVKFAIGQTINAEITPPAQRGAVLSMTVGLVTLAGLAAPYVTGRIVESAADPATGFAIAFAIPGTLMLIGGLLAFAFVRPERDARRIAAHGRHVDQQAQLSPTATRPGVGAGG
ncbi:MFS transporter [Saccharopolyspora indica]|uniref:MFS transporter n=1 Tax=Saccharopolyspora indica TaxID=1229659 RepID=UPI0022EA66CD|nr:MFS transporter [Saccharopolyspora indica]MDA3642781.1 MFS transporter [Saccharopolyspora indica]